MALIPTDVLFPIKAFTRMVQNLDRRLRIVENREVPAGAGPGPTPDPGTDPVTPTLPGAWVPVPPYQEVSYWRDGSNIVHLRGTANMGSVTLPSTLFTLGAGFRPTATLVYGVPTYSVVDVEADGDVIVRMCTSFVSLDGISFRAEQ
jgi:hypothetical protein